MKRETRAWLESLINDKHYTHATEKARCRDALDSDAALRAELRRKDKVEKELVSLLYDVWVWAGCAQDLPPDALVHRVDAALQKPRRAKGKR